MGSKEDLLSRLPREGMGALEGAVLKAGFTADRLVLYQSRPGPAGTTYDELDSFPLAS